MTLYEFKLLSQDRKINTICSHGVRLATRSENDFEIILYAVNYFYVEVLLQLPDRRLADIRSFNTTILLEPYLEQIDIASLFQSI